MGGQDEQTDHSMKNTEKYRSFDNKAPWLGISYGPG